MSLDLFERPGDGERAIIVGVDFGHDHRRSLGEFQELALSAGAKVLQVIQASRSRPDPRYFVGSGKVDEIADAITAQEAELVMFNHQLSASQERNLEKRLQCRVLSRTGLILDIFAQRAQSFEGKLQVELAQLRHLSTRLVRGWTHLERQKGGIGLRGPGETQLESDRRLLGQRIAKLKKRLEKVNSQRHQSRAQRLRAGVPTVSLVGYTNAGKSTLFNRLCGADVYVQDQLFATLDPTVRKLTLAGITDIVLADTVGFVSELPHELVAAFRSTLLETREADLLLHVVDASSEDHQFQIDEVNRVLAEIGAEQVPQMLVYNKIDLTTGKSRRFEDTADETPRLAVSAGQNEGMDLLLQAMAEFFNQRVIQGWIVLAADEGKNRACLFEHGEILSEEHDDNGGCRLHIRIAVEQLQKLGIPAERICSDELIDTTVLAAAR